MSAKDYFGKATTIQALANKSAEEIGGEIESVGYQEQDIVREERFIPRVDFALPDNFARYGLAEEYYSQALNWIANYYPYDGSLKERLKWENESTYLDLYIFDNKYPRTNGYAKFSSDGWGTLSGDQNDGYGLPSSTEYIYFEGGPHPNPEGMSPYKTQFSGSNYYEPTLNRESNLKFDLQTKGATIEFWLKKDAFDATKTEKEVIFDLWNGSSPGESVYGRLRLELTGNASSTAPFRLTVMSGTSGFETVPIGTSAITTTTVADGNWHHYALSLKSSPGNVDTAFYVDGELNTSASVSVGGSTIIKNVTGSLRATLGALITAPTTGSKASAYAGKLTGSVDEFRYWKTQRTGKDISRHWFTQVGGGTNDDPDPFKETTEAVNTHLGVYYKFNEGITGDTSVDSVVLDYSGRITNGSWAGYGVNSRSTGSAMVESLSATKEFKDPIIRTNHPAVKQLATSLQFTGSSHDVNNNSSIYNSIPSWITEEDYEGQKELRSLTQILSSYFDTLHLQLEELSGIKNIQYTKDTPGQKPLPFADKLLNSMGLMVSDLFVDADVLEKLADRSEDRLYEKSLTEIKNAIYQNIYNNLVYIYKTKGTEKSFRNLIRAFGIDDELVKLNMYGNNVEYEIRDNRREVSVADRFVNFNTPDHQYATVYQFQDSADTTNTTGFIPSDTHLTGGFATTLEADVLFPQKLTQESKYYFNTNTISASLFGVHGTDESQDVLTWPSPDRVNFQVYAVRDEIESDNVRFELTGTAGGFVPHLQSQLFEDVYQNTHWNLSVRIRPEHYPRTAQVFGADSGIYMVELHGVQIDSGEVMNEFTVSGSASGVPAAGFVTGSKRVFVGAHRQDFNGTVLQSSDVRVNACRYWLDYVDDDSLRGHAYDTQNYGTSRPTFYPYRFEPTAPYGETLTSDTLLFNWEFAQNTGSNASGQFVVEDEYAHATNPASRQGWIGDILNKQYTARGDLFDASTTKAVDKDFMIISKLQLPENVNSSDMVQVLNAQDQQIFTRDSRPVNYFYAFEKSMASAVSVEMINYFATLKDINTIIGAPVNRYRPEYKGLKVLRQRFFERVSNSEVDFEKFYEFYKWFDSSLTSMLDQLVPASADFAENVRTIIESHMLERSKYQHKLQNVKTQDPTIQGTATGIEATGEMDNSPSGDPQGTGFYSMNAFSRRQIGSSQPINFNNWKFMHAPLNPDNSLIPTLTQNSIWWKSRAERAVHTISSSTAAVNIDKQVLLSNAVTKNLRAQKAPYKFGGSGKWTLGGIGFNQNKKVNYVYTATTPFGALRGGAPENTIAGYGSDVEKLIDTTDVYHPAYKQRLGFDVDPDINKVNPGLARMDANLILPFSIYSSSVRTGYNEDVVDNFTSSVQITNLHHDLVYSSDIPMQGPFTEQFVGGRAARHTPINSGTLDNASTRGEAFKIDISSQELSVVSPNYNATNPGGDPGVPMAHRLRNVGTKRPVNIQNIKITTSSTGLRIPGTVAQGAIGNYSKNYQIVQSNSRRINDPFFNYNAGIDGSGSFAFSLTPQLALGGVVNERVLNTSASAFNDSTKDAYRFTTDAAMNTNDASTWSFWMKTHSPGQTQYIYYDVSKYGIAYFDSLNRLNIYKYFSGTNGVWVTTEGDILANALARKEWFHLAISYDYSSVDNHPAVYVNGHRVPLTQTSVPTGTGTEWGSIVPIGRLNSTQNFDGYISDLAFYNTNLTHEEASYIYLNATLNLKDHSPPRVQENLVYWWRMGNGPDDNTSEIIDVVNGTVLEARRGLSAGPVVLETIDTLECQRGETIAGLAGRSFALPDRSGPNSNQTIIVNRFSSPGEYKTLSRGYLDQPHEELSVYNASPYRNQGAINYGLSGSAGPAGPMAYPRVFGASGSAPAPISGGIKVVDHLGWNRGLNQLSALHCGIYGTDAAFGRIRTVPAPSPPAAVGSPIIATGDDVASTRVDGGLGYSETPSWHKTNRNARKAIKEVESYGARFGPTGIDYVNIGSADFWQSYIGNLNAANEGRPFTFSLWFKPTPDSGDTIYPLMTFGNDDKKLYVSLYSGQTIPIYEIEGTAGSNGRIYGTTHITSGSWWNVTCTYEGGTQGTTGLYVNGLLESNASVFLQVNNPTDIDTYACAIGSGSVGTAPPAIIRDVCIWDRALSPEEAHSLYNHGKIADLGDTSLYSVSSLPQGLLAWYKMDAKSGDSVAASSTIANRAPFIRQPGYRSLPATGSEGVATLAAADAEPFLVGQGPTTVRRVNIYDNQFVQHQIPQSDAQYSWIRSAMYSGSTISGLQKPSSYSGSAFPQLITASDWGLLDVGESWLYPGISANQLPLRFSASAPIGSLASNYRAFYTIGGTSPDYQLYNFVPTSFTGLNILTVDHISSSRHQLGFMPERMAGDASLYQTIHRGDPSAANAGLDPNTMAAVQYANHPPNSDDLRDARDGLIGIWCFFTSSYDSNMPTGAPRFATGDPGMRAEWYWGPSFTRAAFFNSLMLNRNGPYGYPTWKQVRAGDHKVARSLRKKNIISHVRAPKTIVKRNADGRPIGYERGLRPDGFVDYYESPVASSGRPIKFVFEDNTSDPDPANNVELLVSYQNNLDYFSNTGLNNILDLAKVADEGNAYNTVADFAVNNDLSFMVNYSQVVYPKETNAYQSKVRTRERYDIDDVWLDCPTFRWAGELGHNTRRPLSSYWPGETETFNMSPYRSLPMNLYHSGSSVNACLGDFMKSAESNILYSVTELKVQNMMQLPKFSANSQGLIITGSSVWPLDFEYSASEAATVPLDAAPHLRRGNITYGWFPWRNWGSGSMVVYDSTPEYQHGPPAMLDHGPQIPAGKGHATPAGELMNSYCRVVFPGKICPEYYGRSYDQSGYYRTHNLYNPSYYLGDLVRRQVYAGTFNINRAVRMTQARDLADDPTVPKTQPSLKMANSYAMPIFGGNVDPPLNITQNLSWGPVPEHAGYSLTQSAYWAGMSITCVGQVPWTAPYGLYAHRDPSQKTPAPIPDHTVPVWGGNRGIPPYKSYEKVTEKLRLVAKDHTIVPEFRIADHIENFVDQGSNFLDTPSELFTLSGSKVDPKDSSSFFKTYSSTDFMKYFGVIDDDFAGKANAAGTPIERESLELTCKAMLQFIPYKGFYPAERTLYLGSLLSKSMGDIQLSVGAQRNSGSIDIKRMEDGGILRRVLHEPLMAPGILYNTIKSGIAVSNFVVGNLYKHERGNILVPDGPSVLPITEYAEVSNYPLYENLLRSSGSGPEYGMRGAYNWTMNIQSDGRFSGDDPPESNAAVYGGSRAVKWFDMGPVDYDFGGFRPDSQHRGIQNATPSAAYRGEGAYGSPTQTNRTTGSYAFPLLNLSTYGSAKNYLGQATGDAEQEYLAGDGAKEGDYELLTGGYFLHHLPFEAIRDPDKYLGKDKIFNEWLYDTGLGLSAIHAGKTSLGAACLPLSSTVGDIRTKIKYSGVSRSPLYRMGIDNFLCETYNFFLKGPKNTSFVSRQEDEFLSVKSGSFYGMQVELAVPKRWGWDTIFESYGTSSLDMISKVRGLNEKSFRPPARDFGMYSRASAFGPPIAIAGNSTGSHALAYPKNNMLWSYEHVLPPYFYGSAKANIIYEAKFDGKATLDEIIGTALVEYDKDHFWGPKPQTDAAPAGVPTLDVPLNFVYRNQLSASGRVALNSDASTSALLKYDDLACQITSSVDLFEKLMVIPEGTNTQESRWLIQPKFECPVLNFYNVPTNKIGIGSGSTGREGFFVRNTMQGGGSDAGLPGPGGNPIKMVLHGAPTSITSAINPYLEVRGMWHQYGHLPKDNNTLSLQVADLPADYYSNNLGRTIRLNSLRNIVGFEADEKPIGEIASERFLEEAIVCVPYINVNGNRRFFDIEVTTPRYTHQLALLNKYLFPPSFDYLTNPSVSPIAFYAFEFNMKLDQEDLMNIWQNLPPKSYISSEFQKASATVRIRDLVDRLLGTDEDLEWMVFKVKKKAEKDYNVYVKKNLQEGTPIVQPSLSTDYSYNWPYDYCSIVEMVKIESAVVYATQDVLPEEREEEVVPPDLREFIPLDEFMAQNVRPQPPVPTRRPNPPRPPTALTRIEMPRRPIPRPPRRGPSRPPRRPRIRPSRPPRRPRTSLSISRGSRANQARYTPISRRPRANIRRRRTLPRLGGRIRRRR